MKLVILRFPFQLGEVSRMNSIREGRCERSDTERGLKWGNNVSIPYYDGDFQYENIHRSND
jgi:hypothetical protein